MDASAISDGYRMLIDRLWPRGVPKTDAEIDEWARGPTPTTVERLAAFVVARSWEDISSEARAALKIRVLDALGCALGALDGPPVQAIRAQVEELGGNPGCTLIGGRRSAPDRAALLNGAAVRYLDFNDSYFAPGETCHPSDNLAPVLAAAEYVGASGRELLTALAVA